MNETPAAPLKIDLRLGLEAIVDVLGVLFVGVAALNLDMPLRVLIPLMILAALAGINRLLGKSNAAQLKEMSDQLKGLVAQNQVLVQSASAGVIRKAEAAAEAVKPGSAVSS